MNQITKIIKEREEEFDKKLFEENGWFKELGNGDEDWSSVKSHNKATILAVLEALEGWTREQISKKANDVSRSIEVAEYKSAYCEALSDILSLITLIKQEIL